MSLRLLPPTTLHEAEQIDGKDSENGDLTAHRLPCTIHSDGPLPTARAFCSLPHPLTSFRGRSLQNASFELPPSHKCKKTIVN